MQSQKYNGAPMLEFKSHEAAMERTIQLAKLGMDNDQGGPFGAICCLPVSRVIQKTEQQNSLGGHMKG